MPGRIVCLGDVMIDIVATLPGPLALGSDVHAPIQYRPGGSAANTAAWLAAIGAAVTLIGRVGDDAVGTQAHHDLITAGIVDRLQIDWEHPTGTCIVLVSPGGERTMVPDPGANATLDPGELDARDFVAGNHLHVSGYALLGGSQAAAKAALAMTRRAQMTISVDAASAAPLAGFGAREFGDLIGSDLLLFANVAEAEVLTGRGDPAVSVRELATRVGSAVVKAGADGAYWSDGNEPSYAPAMAIEAVDTTGAGDAFAAAFLAATDAGAPPAAALQAANELAAIACRQVGGQPSAPIVGGMNPYEPAEEVRARTTEFASTLIGLSVDAARARVEAADGVILRVVHPGQPVTADFQARRVNAFVENETVVSVSVG
jgi:sugar/nucleoside kinase (ribokinase family)